MAINLNKGQTIDLRKPDGGGLTRVRMGLGWDAKTVTKKTLFGGPRPSRSPSTSTPRHCCAPAPRSSRRCTSATCAVTTVRSSTGDNLTGGGDGDDESIVVDLPAVSARVDTSSSS